MSKSRDIADSAATINYIDNLTSDAQSQLDAKAVYPSQTGNSGKFLTTDGSNVSWASAGGITTASYTCSSDTSITFTGIPAGVKQIRIGFDDVRVTTAEQLVIKLGTSSGIVSTGYQSTAHRLQSTSLIYTSTVTAFNTYEIQPNIRHGNVFLTLVDEVNDDWAGTLHIGSRGSSEQFLSSARINLTDTLTQLEISANGGTFAEGVITIQYQ